VLYTHASVVRVLIDAALAGLRGVGHIYVADAPLQGCDFARFRRQSGLAELQEEYSRAPVEFLDLRQQWAQIDDASSFVRRVHALAGDPRGYSHVALGPHSRLACFGVNARFGVTDYVAHERVLPSYPVSNTVLSADVILNAPKLKTHMKTGMTGALKNFVGIVGSKDFLPHFRAGSPRSGGDEYPDGNWMSRAASPVRGLLQTRAPLWVWNLARAGAGHPRRWLVRQRHALAHGPRLGGHCAQLRAPAPPNHSDAGGCHCGGGRMRAAQAASEAVRAVGVGRRSGHGGCDLRDAYGIRLAQDSAAEPPVRRGGAGVHGV